ncbi:Ig-like domain-containing protein [Mucilaginibacter sp. BT774]|nr:Ig-like domain-containing protein [Mucilaginibacter sp. BT774]
MHFAAFAQRDSIPLTTIIAKTQKLTNDRPVEKVYIHFDKPYYAVNDTIWFKAYVTVDLHQPTTLSKILYVDFINEGQLPRELKLQIVNGIAIGSLILTPDFAKRGNFHVRAYTRWMRNADQAYFFNKTITVGANNPGLVLPRITFKNSISEKVDKINAEIVYKDEDGKPYANKKVSWKALNDDGTISKGKGETNQNGVVSISFTSEKPAELNSSTISADLELEDKKTVTKVFPIQLTPPGIDAQFFPEGGYLISGIRSRVAFKAIKPDGLGIDSKGTIVDNNGTVVANFESQHLGMGAFALTPENGKTYKANFTFADGSQSSFDLPNVRAEGINLSVNNNAKDSLSIKITTNEGFFQKNRGRTFYVMAQSGGVVCYAAQTVLQNISYSATIAKSKFPTGILQITIFSYKGSPLGERVVFIQNNDQLNLSMKTDQSAYSRRQKTRVLVSAKNKVLPSEGNFSVSVINESIVPYDDDDAPNILSQLLLSSDLRGYIEKPGYYFNHHDDNSINDLDVLMLTQGYRRFTYKNLLADKIPPIAFLPEQGIAISGILRNNTGLPIARGNIRLFIPDKAYSTQTVTDANGAFRFPNVLVSDTSSIKITARDNPNSSSLMLSIDPLVAPPSTVYINPVGEITNIDSTLRPYLQNNKKQLNVPRVLEGVVIKAKPNIKKVSHADYSSLTGLSMLADHEIPGDRFKDCNSFSDCLVGAGLGLTYDNNNFYITREYNGGKRTPVAYYVNGMPVDFSYLYNVDPKMVESVEIFNNDGFTNINRTTGTSGVLVVNIKKIPKGEKISKDELLAMLPKNNEIEFIPGGYSTARTFYSPKYESTSTNSAGSDFRSTIYWNPVIVTDKAGNAAFEFFNSDGTGTYKAIIEGIDKDGNIGRYVYRYKVQ